MDDWTGGGWSASVEAVAVSRSAQSHRQRVGRRDCPDQGIDRIVVEDDAEHHDRSGPIGDDPDERGDMAGVRLVEAPGEVGEPRGWEGIGPARPMGSGDGRWEGSGVGHG